MSIQPLLLLAVALIVVFALSIYIRRRFGKAAKGSVSPILYPLRGRDEPKTEPDNFQHDIGNDFFGQIRSLVPNHRPEIKVWLMGQDNIELDEFVLKLQDYIKEYQSEYPHLAIRVFSVGECMLGAAHAAELFRISQEAINNAAHHSGASIVEVIINSGEDRLDLEVVDNGCGFDTTNTEHGLGLKAIRQAVADLDGSCMIISREKEGTTVSVKIPV